MALDEKLLEILVCPICKGELEYDRHNNELICSVHKLACSVEDDIPVMLPELARKMEKDK